MAFANSAALLIISFDWSHSFGKLLSNDNMPYAIVIFFDLEKAYERTWKYGIMKDLHNAGLRGRLPCFIEGFLRN